MKNILSRLKKGFGIAPGSITENTHAVLPAPFMPSTPVLREAITGFIVQSLQPYVDEKSLSVAGMHFYIVCSDAEQEEAARIALYLDKPGLFKTAQLERKLLNHFIQLETDWFFECHLVHEAQVPEQCIRKAIFGLKVMRSGEPVTGHYSKALVEVLTGQAEQNEYILDPHEKLKFYIGRTSTPQLSSGKIQQNDIVFMAGDAPGYQEVTGSANSRVSRNHAYIMYDAKTGSWLLYPDKGGLPEQGNKLKVHTHDDKVKWLNIYGVPHCLAEGDQVELGGAVIIRFREMK
ncbi:MAG: hypothetical protein ABIQ88_00065 [Chitinophagaceae bacterium]